MSVAKHEEIDFLRSPGVPEVRARFFRFKRALISVDLPTFERPAKQTSMRFDLGIPEIETAPSANSHVLENSLRPAEILRFRSDFALISVVSVIVWFQAETANHLFFLCLFRAECGRDF